MNWNALTSHQDPLPCHEQYEGLLLSSADRYGNRFFGAVSPTIHVAVVSLNVLTKCPLDISERIAHIKQKYDECHTLLEEETKLSFVYLRLMLPHDCCEMCGGYNTKQEIRSEERSVRVDPLDDPVKYDRSGVTTLVCKCIDCTFEWRSMCVTPRP